MAKKVEEKIEELEEKTLEQDVNEEMVKIDEEISKLTEENKVLTEKVKLAQAELINYRRRKDEETANILKFANQDLILELLPVVDNFERALESNSESSKFTEGVNLIYQNLMNILTKSGVEVINRVGEVFDPTQEQALVTDCIEDMEDEVVIEVLAKGYKLKGRVIRPASVKINQK
ncbi:MAG: nucleotide exchange factor GrpE [Firmicutes bacterium]|nr:nucleotide exchange factor GrpE [Bacillota bacterium]